MTDEFDAFERRQEIVERRMAHLISDTGLARFEHHPYVAVCERFERRGDRLYEFHEIMTWVIALDPQLTRERVTILFVQSVKHGGFGWRQCGRVVANLINLHNFGNSILPGHYFLRSTGFRIGENPRPWRSSRSIWVQWLRAQSLPVPIELASGVTIEGEIVDRGGQSALPGPPAGKVEPTMGPQLRGNSDALYKEHVRVWLADAEHNGRYPSRKDDENWAHSLKLKLSDVRGRVRKWRETNIPAEVRRGGSPGKSSKK